MLSGALLSASAASACRHAASDPPTTPGPPITAQGDVDLASMDAECSGLIAAVDAYGQCPNLDESDRRWASSVIENAEKTFAAGKKATPDEPSQHAIAAACHRARESMLAATARCQNGPRPRSDWE